MMVKLFPAYDNQFSVEAWRAEDWFTTLKQLRQQLEAAKAIFPNLNGFVIEKKF